MWLIGKQAIATGPIRFARVRFAGRDLKPCAIPEQAVRPGVGFARNQGGQALSTARGLLPVTPCQLGGVFCTKRVVVSFNAVEVEERIGTMGVYDLFSKRGKPLPDVFQYDTLPKKFRNQVWWVWIGLFGKPAYVLLRRHPSP